MEEIAGLGAPAAASSIGPGRRSGIEPSRRLTGLAAHKYCIQAHDSQLRYRPRPVLRRAGFHRLPRLGAGALRPRRDGRLRLRPAPSRRARRARRACASAWPRCDPAWAARLGEDHVVTLDALGRHLRHRADPRRRDRDRPTTACRPPSCPAATWSSSPSPPRWPIGAAPSHLVAGMCETDYSGYPGLPRRHHQGHAGRAQPRHGPPLRDPYAADVDRQGGDLRAGRGARRRRPSSTSLVEDTHTCYLGDRTHRHDWGYGCGTCPACQLRAQGLCEIHESEETHDR